MSDSRAYALLGKTLLETPPLSAKLCRALDDDNVSRAMFLVMEMLTFLVDASEQCRRLAVRARVDQHADPRVVVPPSVEVGLATFRQEHAENLAELRVPLREALRVGSILLLATTSQLGEAPPVTLAAVHDEFGTSHPLLERHLIAMLGELVEHATTAAVHLHRWLSHHEELDVEDVRGDFGAELLIPLAHVIARLPTMPTADRLELRDGRDGTRVVDGGQAFSDEDMADETLVDAFVNCEAIRWPSVVHTDGVQLTPADAAALANPVPGDTAVALSAALHECLDGRELGPPMWVLATQVRRLDAPLLDGLLRGCAEVIASVVLEELPEVLVAERVLFAALGRPDDWDVRDAVREDAEACVLERLRSGYLQPAALGVASEEMLTVPLADVLVAVGERYAQGYGLEALAPVLPAGSTAALRADVAWRVSRDAAWEAVDRGEEDPEVVAEDVRRALAMVIGL